MSADDDDPLRRVGKDEFAEPAAMHLGPMAVGLSNRRHR